MTPSTPDRRVPNPLPPPVGATHATDDPGWHIRVTHDPAGTLAAAFHCLAPVAGEHCYLPQGHRGTHLPLPHPRPHADDTRANPSSRKKAS